MTLIVGFELCMCRTHGGSFLLSWDPATELGLSVFTHSASTAAHQDGVSMHVHFVLCSYPCSPCHFLLSVPPLLIDLFLPINSSLIFLLFIFFKLENAAFVFLNLASFTDWWSTYQVTNDRMLYSLWLSKIPLYTLTPVFFTDSSAGCWPLWTGVWEAAPLYGDSNSSYGSGVVYITRSMW